MVVTLLLKHTREIIQITDPTVATDPKIQAPGNQMRSQCVFRSLGGSEIICLLPQILRRLPLLFDRLSYYPDVNGCFLLNNLRRHRWLRTIYLVSGDELGQTLTFQELGELSSHTCESIFLAGIRLEQGTFPCAVLWRNQNCACECEKELSLGSHFKIQSTAFCFIAYNRMRKDIINE